MSTPENEVYQYLPQEAEIYDRRAKEGHWSGPDVVFGSAYEFLNTGESLIDLGIGTGLGSKMFCKAGLEVYGLDGSPEILKVCEQRDFVKDIKCHDMNKMPYPYEDNNFNHAICVGVLNLFGDLESIFCESSRIIKDRGIFGFTVEDSKNLEIDSYEHTSRGSGTKIQMHKHSEEYIKKALQKAKFTLVKRVEFWPFRENFRAFGMFCSYVAMKSN